MFLNKLEINGFGKLKNLDIPLKKGINIIYGNNESGKSTIQRFIKGIIYGLYKKKGSNELISEYLKYKPWDSYSGYNGSLEYILDNNRKFRIERDFEIGFVKVFDENFIDVTNTFNYSKFTKDIMIGETHLGINYSCFEKISFIKQLEVGIGNDSQSDILNRITNIYQSGFEDVSHTKIREIIKSIVLNYIGTDKTSVRPLNIVNNKIDKLKERKENLNKLRSDFIESEIEINKLSILELQKNTELNLIEEKIVILKLEILSSDTINKIIKLKEAYDFCKSYEDEVKIIEEKIKDFEITIKENANFSAYDSDDVENMMIAFYEQSSIEKELDSIKNNIDEKYAVLDEVKYNDIYQIFSNKENLEIEDVRNKLNIMEKKIKEEKSIEIDMREDLNKYMFIERILLGSTLSFVLISFLIVVLKSFMKLDIPIAVFIVHPVTLTTLFLFIYFSIQKNKKGTKINKLLIDEINRKSKIENLEEEFKIINNEMIEKMKRMKLLDYNDYVFKKEQYVKLMEKCNLTEHEIDNLEQEHAMESRKINLIQNSIKEILFSVGIISIDENYIDEDHVREFKFGVTKYKGTEPSIKYSKQRVEDLKLNIENYKKQATIIYGEEIEDISYLSEIINKLEDESILHKNEISRLIENSEIKSDFEQLLDSDSKLDKKIELENKLFGIRKELVDIKIKKNDLTSLAKSFNFNESDLQNIEGEIISYEEKKSDLEKKAKILNLTLNLLDEANNELRVNFVPKLNNKVGEYSKIITNNRYNDIRIKEDLNIKLKSVDAKKIVGLEYLSMGTIDQIYLSLRLAVANFMSKNEKLPIIIDEAFSLYDDIRMREVLMLLNNISKENQVILFICKDNEVNFTKKYCNVNNYIDLNTYVKESQLLGIDRK
ncbi:MAG: AAA family ATPase [Clostridiales bacterium]